MAELTLLQITDMQGDLAIGNDESVFTDDELQRLYVRAGEDYNAAVYYAFRQILASKVTSWINYQVALTKVDRSKAFDNLKTLLAIWQDLATTGANQVKIVGINSVPSQHKPRPADEYPKPWPYRWNRWRY